MKKTFAILMVLGLVACQSPVSVDENVDNHVKHNEGSTSFPVVLTMDTPHTVKLGKLMYSETNSYYRFTVPGDGDYQIVGTDFSVVPGDDHAGFTGKLYGSLDFESPISTDPYTANLSANGLVTGTTYGLSFVNLYFSNDDITFTVSISEVP